MISIHPNIVERAIDSISCDFVQKEALQKIKDLKTQFKSNEEIKFIDNIIDEFKTKKKDFIKISPSEIKQVKNKIGASPNKSLKDKIIEILDYNGKRNSYFPKIFQKIGIKTCVYCNAQSTLTIELEEGEEKKLSARYQLDHYYSKSEYPYLSIAVFNLYPVCASCNLAKKDEEYENYFELYKEQTEPSPFKFELNKASKALFLTTRNCEDLEVKFNNIEIEEDKLNINEIYKEHKDIAEEIILKRLAYNETYRKILNKLCEKHKITKQMIKRFILGNYTEEREIHKRPFAKFMQDIGKEVGLIE